MSRRNRSQSFSLFPFLAVLISTMGVLVVILLLVAHDANNQNKEAQNQSKKELQTESESWQNKIDLHQSEQEVYKLSRDSIARRLTDQQARRSHFETENRLLRKQAIDLRNRFSALQETIKDASETQQVSYQIRQQQKVIHELRQRLDGINKNKQNQQGNADRKPIYSIVPIASLSGTNRRPIYIQCSKDGVRLFPGDIRLSQKDFLPPLHNGNPLDSALIAYREFWRNQANQNPAASSGSQALQNKNVDNLNAYPLIVLRPSGANWYGAVRKAMSSWADQFGYELVPEEWELDFGEGEPGLKQAVEEAISIARKRSEKLRLAADAYRRNEYIRQNVANAQRRQGSIGNHQGGSRSSRTNSPTKDLNWSDVRSTGGQVAAGAVDSRVVQSDGRRSRYLENANDPVALLSAGFHKGESSSPKGSGTSTNSLAINNSSSAFGSPGSQDRSVKGNKLGNSSQDNSIPSSFNGRAPKLSQNSGTSNPFADRSRSSRSLGSGGTNGSSGGRQTQAFGSGSGKGNSSSSGMNQAGSGGPSSSPNGNGSANQGSKQNGSSSKTSGSQNKSGSAGQPDSIANRRGKNWALPSKRKISSAYFRPIGIEIHPNKIVLRSDAWNGKQVDVPTNGLNVERVATNLEAQRYQSFRKAMDPLIDQVWNRVESWGSLGVGGYWKPVLKVRKMPGAEDQARWLQSLLHNSGLEVEVVK